MKKLLALLLSLMLVLGALSGCADTANSGSVPMESPVVTETPAATEEQASVTEAPTTRSFTDSLGRTVDIPSAITRVAVGSTMAQILLFALCPDMLVGIAIPWDAAAAAYFDTKYHELPILGQLHGNQGGVLNLEELLMTDAQLVIDVGEPKEGLAEELDALQAQTGLIFVHISAYLDTMGESYRMLGELLGLETEAETLAAYCEGIYSQTISIASSVEKARVLYLLGDQGLNVIAAGSYHAGVIDLLSDNLAVVENPTGKGTGNEVDMEQILSWDPDYILFAPDSIYASVDGDATWQLLHAIANGNYYVVPFGPLNWLGFPPSAQCYLGMLWMSKLLYPEAATYDLYEAVAEYYQLFYHCTLTEAQYSTLVANSMG